MPGEAQVVVAREVERLRLRTARAQGADEPGGGPAAGLGVDPVERGVGHGAVPRVGGLGAVGPVRERSVCRQPTDPSRARSRSGCGNTHTLARLSCLVPPWLEAVPYVRISFHGPAEHAGGQGAAARTADPRRSARRTGDLRRRTARRGGRRREGAPSVVRTTRQTQLSGQPQVGPLPRGLLVLLAAARLQGRDPQVHLAEAGGGVQGRRRRGRRRGEAGLPGGERTRPDRPGRRPGHEDHRGHQGGERGRRGVRLPRSALRRAGRPAAFGGRRRVQPQPQHVRGDVRGDHHHAHLRGPGGDRAAGPGRRALGVLRADRRDGRERQGPGGRGVRAARPGPGLGAGELPDPVRGDPARQGVEPHPPAVPAHPRDGPLRLPRRRGAARGRPRGAPALDAAAGAAPGQLHLPGRLPDE